MNRREFMISAAAGAALTSGAAQAAALLRRGALGAPPMDIPEIAAMGNFCAHEHWGSVNAIGMTDEGFRADTEAGATPSRPAGVWDIVADPYFGGWLHAAGAFAEVNAEHGARDPAAWFDSDPVGMLTAWRPHLERQICTGAFQCIRRGVMMLHGPDLAAFDPAEWKEADASIRQRYGDLFGWYRTAMDQAGFTELIRPVHPEFYGRKQEEATATQELAFTRTIMRIDPLLDMAPGKNERRDALAEWTGVEPVDPASWRAFLDKLFDIAAKGGTTGIKQLQAYSRSLDFEPREDADVTWTGELSWDQRRAFQDWVMHECCKRANDRGWPHQIHVGTHNLRASSPLPLRALAQRYPKMKLVQLHCWPFIEEAGHLAKLQPNVYIDTCWEPVLSPAFLEQALHTWLSFVPAHKIMLSHDSTSVEMAAGSSLFTRDALSAAMDRQRRTLGVSADMALRLAQDMLHNNAVRVYGCGELLG